MNYRTDLYDTVCAWRPKAGLILDWFLIEPTEALLILDEFNTNNRKISEASVRLYRGIMQRGKWLLNHHGMLFCFNEDGNLYLGDGANRLRALSDAELSVVFQVTIGLPMDAQATVDQPRKRLVHDTYVLQGEDWTKVEAQIAKVFLSAESGGSGGVVAPDIMLKTWLANKDSIRFTANAFYRHVRGITTQFVKVVVARAYYHIGEYEHLYRGRREFNERLKQFAHVLISGLAEKNGLAAIRLRDWLQQKSSGGVYNSASRLETYQRASSALHNFLLQADIAMLKKFSYDLFPIVETNAQEEHDKDFELKPPHSLLRKRATRQPFEK